MGKRELLLVVVLIVVNILVAGCGTIRGATALLGGITKDTSQLCQHVIDHTNPNEAPLYKGIGKAKK